MCEVKETRGDKRCGCEFPLPNGAPAKCESDGKFHCCSEWGFCGDTAEHCNCPTCIDYREGK